MAADADAPRRQGRAPPPPAFVLRGHGSGVTHAELLSRGIGCGAAEWEGEEAGLIISG